MSDSTVETLSNNGYKNWMKGGLGLLTVKDVLCKYTEYIVKDQYEKILAEKQETDTKYRSLKKAAKDNHLFKQSSWVNSKLNNTPPPEEELTYVEYGKCFIRPPGYRNKSSISDIDYPGLLHILINNKGFHDYLEDPPSRDGDKIKEPHVFAQGLNVRNDIRHSSDDKLETTALDGYLIDLTAVLGNLKPLPKESGADEERIKKAKEYLSQLQEIDFHISTTNELKVVQEAINSHESEIKHLKEEQIRSLGSVDKIYEKHNGLELRQNDLEQRVRKLERNREVQDELATSLQMHTRQKNYIKQKQDLQDSLIMLYTNFYIKTSSCPLKPRDNNITISDIYVKPVMIVEEPRRSTKKSMEPVDLVRNCPRKTKKIFVIDNVGTGKTSLCKVMLHSWCHAVEDSRKF